MVGRVTPVRAVALHFVDEWRSVSEEFCGRLGDSSLPFDSAPKCRNRRRRRVGADLRRRFRRTRSSQCNLREGNRAANHVRRGCGYLVSVRCSANKKGHPLGTQDLPGAR